jgi:hypothetical protein
MWQPSGNAAAVHLVRLTKLTPQRWLLVKHHKEMRDNEKDDGVANQRESPK